MKLVLVIPALTAGGAERVMSILANHWADKGWDIVLLTLDDGAAPPFFPLDGRIRHRPLGLLADSANPLMGLFNNLRRLAVLRKAIREARPEAVVSFLDTTNVLTLLACRGLPIPVIAAEHIDPAQYPIKPVWAALRRVLYPRAERVVVLTERALAYFPPALQSRCRVFPNPVQCFFDEHPPEIKLPPGRRIIAMGRLVEQKGFDILLKAFAGLCPAFPDWSLIILGEGPQRAELETLRRRLGLSGRVHLPGQVKRPEPLLIRSDLFVLSSRFEGFPMALCEAMAAGLPVIAADCPTGPREIIRDGVDGVLVPAEDSAALASAMQRLMADPGERKCLGSQAQEIVERFGIERVAGLWDDLLAEIVHPLSETPS
jgi:GalNAc-alpha-(1->4)-GalNAc-alpha-(1->3)-diNAcBac-PP-undecaprenol alpha-1,4-N-acetyl-D-galactosaminyltransferase